MGKYFEDFAVGEESTTAGRTVTETDIVNFAGITGDWNEIHTNKELIGDTIRVKQKVEGKSERDEHSGIVTMLNEVINQREEVVVSYTAKVLLKRRR